MGYDKHRHTALRKTLYNVENFADHFGVKRRGGLVKKHYFRIHCHGADNSRTLFLTAREL